MFHEVLLIPIYTKSKWDAKRKLKSWIEIGIRSLVQIELGKRCFKEYPVAGLYNLNKESIHPEKTGFHILDRDKTPPKRIPKRADYTICKIPQQQTGKNKLQSQYTICYCVQNREQ
jgi:hypothetical protein